MTEVRRAVTRSLDVRYLQLVNDEHFEEATAVARWLETLGYTTSWCDEGLRLWRNDEPGKLLEWDWYVVEHHGVVVVTSAHAFQLLYVDVDSADDWTL